jgi:predicted acetyltransferase
MAIGLGDLMSPGSFDGPRLIEPRADLHLAFLEMVADYRRHGEERYQRLRVDSAEDFENYIARLSSQSRGEGLRPGHVPDTTFWLVDAAAIVGVSRLRHFLAPALEIEGGHIGYDVPPSYRGRGNGTLLLALTLNRAHQLLRIGRVLVTCDAGNGASARVIERNGGRLQDEIKSSISGAIVRRYWIVLNGEA